MPIRPENRARYPKEWKAIVEQVRERSGDRCEGSPDYPDCRVPNGVIGHRDADGQFVELARRGFRVAYIASLHPDLKVFQIVLTTAHLDHVPENCDLSNLRHWCQRCHLNYDKHHHAQTMRASRRARLAVADLFADTSPSL